MKLKECLYHPNGFTASLNFPPFVEIAQKNLEFFAKKRISLYNKMAKSYANYTKG
jgi:hypothetical protein